MKDELEIKPEVAKATVECPNPEVWHCYDNTATEVEVMGLLRMLVIATKPQIAIETGTYKGINAQYLADGLKYNGFGKLHSADINPEFLATAAHRLADYAEFVQLHHWTGVELIQHFDTIDFAFLDSGSGKERLLELVTLRPKLSPRAIVAVHDTNTESVQSGGPRNMLISYTSANDMQLLTIDTPRGLMLLKKN